MANTTGNGEASGPIRPYAHQSSLGPVLRVTQDYFDALSERERRMHNYEIEESFEPNSISE